MYKKIGVAIAFSPRMEAIMHESIRLQKLFEAELVLIHVGPKNDPQKHKMERLINDTIEISEKTKLVWKEGNPAGKILSIASKEKIDLLIAGALHKESVVKFYFGSIARKLIRKSKCSILMLINPSKAAKPFRRIVINGTEGKTYRQTIERGIQLALIEDATQVHIFKGIKLFGLSMAIAGEEETEHDQEETRREIVSSEIEEIDKILKDIDTKDLKINIKVAAGKPGYELRRFTERMHADLLMVKSPNHRLNFLDRIFPHYLELVMEDLPSNLLIDKSQ